MCQSYLSEKCIDLPSTRKRIGNEWVNYTEMEQSDAKFPKNVNVEIEDNLIK